jgi:predicted enzyme related to lactoylglutathione lyase
MRLTGVSPVLLVADLDRSLAFYGGLLAFACERFGTPANFAVVQRDDAILLLALAPDDARIVPNWHIVEKTWNAYIRVEDVDALFAEVQERGCPIDYGIYDAPHGFREFGVTDPDGYDIAFGQRI